ncbi:MAG TPA: Rid family hydrolase [Terriglobales bacterium]|nr:Rid family hydrolase [Terriglobales bacterium]
MKVRYLLPLLLVAGLSWAQQTERAHLKSKLAQERHLPFSSGVLVGNTLYIAGVTGVNPSTKGPVTPEEEARLVMNQVKQVVEQAGMTMDDIVALQVFCTDLANYDAFNDVYQTYFHGDFPARAFLGTSTLLFGARYEVLGVAVRSGK